MKYIVIALLLCSCSSMKEEHIEQPSSMPTEKEMCDDCYNERLKCIYKAKTEDDEYRCKIEWKQCVVDCYGYKRT